MSFGSCRYYPTCSNYAKIQFEHNRFLPALYFSILRILKCNPLFDGGFDYPKIKCISDKKINLKFNKSYPDGMPRKLLDSSTIYSLGWKPIISIEKGLRKTLEWYKENIK